MPKGDSEGQYVEFDAQEFFDGLLAKLELAKAQDLRPAIKEEPFWMFSVPEEVTNGQITKFFMMMVKENKESLELHYGNSTDGEFYQVSFTGASKEDFLKCVREITDHVYGDLAT
jgi:hypothetical protein